MNPVTMILFNTTAVQLKMAENAAISALHQDIPTTLWIYNNGSTGPTGHWLRDLVEEYPERVTVSGSSMNRSPVAVANEMMATLFKRGAEYILGLPGDVIVPTNFYSQCLRWPRGLVTASMTENVHFPVVDEARAVSENTPMAVVLLRRWVYEALMAKDGFFFRESLYHYASDCDLALRLAACGIHGVQLDMPYFHAGSASLRLADPVTHLRMCGQADKDRETFIAKWNFAVHDDAYGRACGDINFRGESKE